MGLLASPFNPSRYNYYKKYYANNLRHKYSDINTYRQLINEVSRKNAITTSKNISVKDSSIITNASPKDIIKLFGRPGNTLRAQVGELPIKILLHKHSIGGYRVKSEFHFYRNKLFYFNHNFNYLKENEINIIINAFQSKYLDNQVFDGDTNYIQHHENDYIVGISSTIGVTIDYFLIKNNDFYNKYNSGIDAQALREKELHLLKVSDLYNKL